MLPALRGLFAASIAVAVIPFGATDYFWMHAAAFVLAITLTLAIATQPLPDRGSGRLLGTAIAIVAVLAVCLIGQSASLTGNPLAHPGWIATTEPLTRPAAGSISVDPAATLGAIPYLAQPFLTFIAVLLLFKDDQAAASLLEVLAWFCGAVAIFGIVQFTLFPSRVLWADLGAPSSGVTGTFINRNSAATFFGIGAVLSLGMVGQALAKMDLSAVVSGVVRGHVGFNGQGPRLAMALVLTLVLLVALFLTQSRGGLAATFVGLVITSLAIALGLKRHRAGLMTHVFVSLPLLLGSLAFFVLYAERTIRRIGTQGLEDARWCINEATLRAIAENPVLGTGFATFEHVFPMFRDSDCLGIDNSVYRAHNSYLEGYLGLGLPFAVITIVCVVVLVRTYVEGYRERRRFRFAPAAGLGVLAVAMLHSLVDFSLQIPGVAVVFAAALGAGAVISLRRPRAVPRL